MSTKIIWSDDLARQLGLSEDAVLELARVGGLPFAVSTAAPRRLFVDRDDLAQWQAAAKRACCHHD